MSDNNSGNPDNPTKIPIPDPFTVKSSHIRERKDPFLFVSMRIAVILLLYASGFVANSVALMHPGKFILSVGFMCAGCVLMWIWEDKIRHWTFCDGIATGVQAFSEYAQGELNKTFKRWKEQRDSTTTPTE